MKAKIKLIAPLMAVLLLMAGCESAHQEPEVSEALTTEQTTSAAQTTAATEKPKQKIKPLSPSSWNGYYEDEEFSLTAELDNLQSSLYYPDIVNDMGANPKLFVVSAWVKVRNMTYEDKSFDCSKLSLTDGSSELYLYSSDFENMENIKSGKTESAELRFLCTIEQAAAIESMSYDGNELDIGDEFISEKLEDIIDKQSADDVRDYLYRTYVIHRASGYFFIDSSPTTYEMHHIKGIKDGEKNYLAVTFTAYNRSDYAQLIDPKGFVIACGNGSDGPIEQAEALYIDTNEALMYEPKEVDLRLSGTGTLYEIPDFICMKPEGGTEFTIIYDAKSFTHARYFSFAGAHEKELYYSNIEIAILFDKEMW
ncbi:MAG: HNH endonuclease [Oscillospiraceae bacterium]|nr:HNH endonuclease [Oscillospiraceae bacterium]